MKHYRHTFGAVSLRDNLVRGELAAVISGDGLDEPPVRVEQPDRGHSRLVSPPTVRQPLHDDEIRGAFGDGEYGVPIGVQDGVHLPVPEPYC